MLSRRRRHRGKPRRNWADLPTDPLLTILGRLDHIDVLMSADLVCRSWRQATRDEPSLWRRITMRGDKEIATKVNLCAMACEAVRRSAGQCAAFCGEYAGDDGLLIFLAKQALCLKSLRLISCNGVTSEGLRDALKDLPLLEELELSLCRQLYGGHVYEIVANACPQLEHLRLRKLRFHYRNRMVDSQAQRIANMRGLRSLHLFSIALTNEELATILDSCPKLESLDIRHCFNIKMDKVMWTKCAGIKMVRLPGDPTDDYDLQIYNPIFSRDKVLSHWFSFLNQWINSEGYSEPDNSEDSSESDDPEDYDFYDNLYYSYYSQ